MSDTKKTTKQTTRKKISKKKRRMRNILSVFLIMIASLLTYKSAQEVLTTIQLHQEISSTNLQIEELQDQQAKLEEQKKKFEDEEYIKRYARGKYLMSKEGETIYHKAENQDEGTENSEE